MSVAQVARDLGLTENVLHRWKKELSQHGAKAFPGHGQPIEAELARLRRENGAQAGTRYSQAGDYFFRPTSPGRLTQRASHTVVCYQFMLVQQGRFSIEAMCRVLRVSRSGFYDFKACPQNQGIERDRELKTKIQSIFKEYKSRYGSPRIRRELREQGVRCSQKRVARLMKELKLVATKPRRFVATTDSRHGFPVAANLLNREFNVDAIADVNRTWAGDITYIPTAQGWLYLAVVLDLKSRKVIGWSMKDTMDKSLVQEALTMATKRRLPRSLSKRNCSFTVIAVVNTLRPVIENNWNSMALYAA